MQSQQLRNRFLATSLWALAAILGGMCPVRALAADILLCPKMHAKQMPTGFRVPAMKFTGPAGDGRRGSAGFFVQTRKLLKGGGTRLSFTFHRDASGYSFQVIHPFEKGHALISVHSGVAIHRGGSWRDIGWGNPATSDKVKLTKDAAEVLPLKAKVAHKVVSQLTADGRYQLSIDGKAICQHTVKSAKPLVLAVPKDKSVWAGSGFDRTPFAGKDFNPKLQAGHAGLILGPMDGSGPRQNFQQIRLGAAVKSK